MKVPCEQCLVSPCCTRRCNDKIEYDADIRVRSEKRFDVLSDTIAFVIVFGTLFSPIWILLVYVLVKELK